jgi:phosphoglycerate dehydrogenase-like enzyme
LVFTENKNEADIILSGSKKIELDGFDNLKAIFRAGVGRDNVPEKEAIDKGIVVRYPSLNTVSTIFEETANYTCSLILKMHYSNVGDVDGWIKNDRASLSNKKLLVVGMGNIGSRVYKKMKNFMGVDSFDVQLDEEGELGRLLEKSDFVSLHIPNSKENKGFIDSKKLSLMKDNSILINTARGATVDEESLYKEIKNKRLKAAFDVFWDEPYTGILKEYHPENFYMSPHVSSTCSDFLVGCRKDLDELINEMSNV